MNKYANLNLKSGRQVYSYICEYNPKHEVDKEISDILMSPDRSTVIFNYEDTVWNDINKDTWRRVDKDMYLPHDEHHYDGNKEYKYKTSYIDVYFPDYSLDLYRKTIGVVKYEIIIKTWIYSKEIILGRYLLSRADAVACNRVRDFAGNKYYEFIRVPILDPYELNYADEWKKFRIGICDEPISAGSENAGTIEEIKTLNNNGAVIHIILRAVQPSLNDPNVYMDIDYISNCQNSINISKDTNDYLDLKIKTNLDESLRDMEPHIDCELQFNKLYNGSLKDYMEETYQIFDFSIKYSLAIGDKENIYELIETPYRESSTTSDEDLTHCIFRQSTILKRGNFTNWVGWKEGINLRVSAEILSDTDSIITLMSNVMPLTQELYKYFVADSNFKGIHNIELNDLGMENINITTTNKIEHKIYNVKRYEDSKANIAFPVFYKILPIWDIVLHPEVNENICINLDDYKSLVDLFILQIEGVKFKEIGRNHSGVIFKIIGANLPQKISNGTYYILDSESNLLATGKYKYEK